MGKFRLVYKVRDYKPVEIKSAEIDGLIGKDIWFAPFIITGHLTDGAGDSCGLKCECDLGHGYGFNNGYKEIELRIGEKFSFDHEYTDIEGPSDWHDDYFTVTVWLEAEE